LILRANAGSGSRKDEIVRVYRPNVLSFTHPVSDPHLPSVSSATVYCLHGNMGGQLSLFNAYRDRDVIRRIHLPKVPKRPHFKVFDLDVFFLFRKTPVFARASSTSWGRRIRLWLRNGGRMPDVMFIYLFFMTLRARGARPSVAT
jgi:hypothetical protein